MSKIKNTNYILIIVILIFIASGIILSYSLNKKEPVSVSQKEDFEKEEIQKKENIAPIVSTPPEEKWETYTNSELGFSIKYPEMVYGIYRCSPKKPFWVPLKVFEDNENGIVYITEEYCYEEKYDRELDKYIGPCEKIINSLESLKSQRETVMNVNDKVSLNCNPFLTKVFIIKNIKNDAELNEFIKDNYGKGCFAGNKKLWKQSGVYEIKVKGEDWGPKTNLGNTTCPCNYTYKILYAPEKNKLMSVNLGQECQFGTDHNSEDYKCYDYAMINSFQFE